MMHKYYLIFLTSIIGLIFVAGCQQQEALTCNKPYILVGTECCLDQNNNSICDEDEIIKQNKTKETIIEDDKVRLENTAKKLGRAMEYNDFGEMYDMLEPLEQSFKTREEFTQLFPLVWGKDAFISVIFNHADMEESPEEYGYLEAKGYVYYDITDNYGYEYKSSAYNFLKVDGKWYFGGFDVSSAGCFDITDCYEEPEKTTLIKICKEKCNYENLYFIEGVEQFSCDDYICNCVCWNQGKTIGTHISPF